MSKTVTYLHVVSVLPGGGGPQAILRLRQNRQANLGPGRSSTDTVFLLKGFFGTVVVEFEVEPVFPFAPEFEVEPLPLPLPEADPETLFPPVFFPPVGLVLVGVVDPESVSGA